MLSKNDLISGCYYFGDGREGSIAYWSGDMFYSIGCSFGIYEANPIKYGDSGFSPAAVITAPKESGEGRYTFPAGQATKIVQKFAHNMENKLTNAFFLHGGKECYGNQKMSELRARESVQTYIDMKVLESDNG